MSATLDVDLRRFEAGLVAWARGLGISFPEAVRQQMGLLLKAVIRQVPPKSLAQGRKAVERDIRRAADPLFERQPPRDVRLAEMAAAGDAEGLQAALQNSPALQGYRIVPWQPQLHKSARRRGRVKRPQGKAVPQKQDWKRYVAETQRTVGRAKGSIAATLIHLGQTVPAWIARHARYGTTIDRTRGNPNKARITMISRVSYLRHLGIDRILHLSVIGRTRAMKSHLNRILRDRARRAGFSAR